MVWFKVDDSLPFHAKVVQAGNPAMGLWVRAGAWSAQQLTDGFVPDHIVTTLGTRAQAKRLAEVGLWRRANRDGATGYEFHQWNEDGRQPTRQVVEKERSEARERMRKAREAKKVTANGSAEVRANTGRSSGDVRSTRPDPARPDPSLGSSVETYGGNGQEVDARDGDDPPRCIRHNNLPRYDEPPCKACERLRLQWQERQERRAADEEFHRPAWCGACDEWTRLVETDDGMARCRTCHPLAVAS